jgi:hypothetical protein
MFMIVRRFRIELVRTVGIYLPVSSLPISLTAIFSNSDLSWTWRRTTAAQCLQSARGPAARPTETPPRSAKCCTSLNGQKTKTVRGIANCSEVLSSEELTNKKLHDPAC